jgi:hypothetical protein
MDCFESSAVHNSATLELVICGFTKAPLSAPLRRMDDTTIPNFYFKELAFDSIQKHFLCLGSLSHQLHISHTASRAEVQNSHACHAYDRSIHLRP